MSGNLLIAAPWTQPVQVALHRLNLDAFVLSLAGVVLAASVLPCVGAAAVGVHWAGMAAISSLFFLQGARLSRSAVLAGATHWRLHAAIAGVTFVGFPLLALALRGLLPGLLPDALWLGVLFFAALPSTVQSWIALTSIAQGNVAGAVCAATASNVVGIVLTPALFGALSAADGGGEATLEGAAMLKVVGQLLAPFLLGHALRPWIGDWAARHKPLLTMTDRSSILLVVYGAFSAAVVHGVWRQAPAPTMFALAALMVLTLGLAIVLLRLLTQGLRLGPDDEAAVVFCGSQKSLVSGVPIAGVLFSPAAVGPALLPVMVYYPAQLVVGAWLARRYARAARAPELAVFGVSPR